MFRLVIIFLCTVSIKAYASQSVDVLVTNRNIKKGEIINHTDLSYESKDSKLNKKYLSTIDLDSRVVRASRNLESGHLIRRNDLYVDSAIIHKGENITVKFIKKNLSIEIPCTALSNGNVGDIIKVRSLDTNKTLSGKVMSDGTILIGN